MGGGGEHAAKGSGFYGNRQGRTSERGYPLYFRRRLIGAKYCDHVWTDGTEYSVVWLIRCLFHSWGILIPCSYGSGGGLWGTSACGYLEPFCECGETISLSLGICQSKALISYLDGYRKRSLYTWQKTNQSAHYRNHHRESGGLRSERLNEHGGCHGAGSL